MNVINILVIPRSYVFTSHKNEMYVIKDTDFTIETVQIILAIAIVISFMYYDYEYIEKKECGIKSCVAIAVAVISFLLMLVIQVLK